MSQNLDSTKQIIGKIIDEQYNPRNTNEKALLEDLVEEEMVSKGLDPLNKIDVQKYWKSKGVDPHGELYFLQYKD